MQQERAFRMSGWSGLIPDLLVKVLGLVMPEDAVVCCMVCSGWVAVAREQLRLKLGQRLDWRPSRLHAAPLSEMIDDPHLACFTPIGPPWSFCRKFVTYILTDDDALPSGDALATLIQRYLAGDQQACAQLRELAPHALPAVGSSAARAPGALAKSLPSLGEACLQAFGVEEAETPGPRQADQGPWGECTAWPALQQPWGDCTALLTAFGDEDDPGLSTDPSLRQRRTFAAVTRVSAAVYTPDPEDPDAWSVPVERLHELGFADEAPFRCGSHALEGDDALAMRILAGEIDRAGLRLMGLAYSDGTNDPQNLHDCFIALARGEQEAAPSAPESPRREAP